MWLTQKDQLLNRGLEVWKPIIAAVNGFCVGGGMTMLFATDIRVASEHATFGLSEVKRGIIAGNGGTQRTLQQLPWCIGMEMLLTGDPIDAQTAARWGLINKVVPHKDLMKSAREYARPHRRQRAARGAGGQGAGHPLARHRHQHRPAHRATDRPHAARTEDAKEGPKAFREKRKPNFKGN